MPRPAPRRLHTPLAVLLLAAILAGAAVFRFTGVNWDGGQHIHPDERWISIVASELHWPDEPSKLLQPNGSPLNPFWGLDGPRSFAYGHMPLYLLRGTASGLAAVSRELDLPSDWLRRAPTYDAINLVGRYLSGLADLVTILFVFLIGRRLYGNLVGLTAALLLGATVLHIQLAHFYAFDAVQATFVVISVYFAIRLAEGGGLGDAILLGVSVALAVASKFSALPLLFSVAVACLLVYRPWRSPAWRASQRLGTTYSLPGARAEALAPELRDALLLFGLIAAVGLIVYALTSPYVLLDFDRFLRSIRHESAMVRGAADLPYTRQYRGTVALLYQARQLFWFGLGPALFTVSLLGLGMAVWRTVRRRAPAGEVVILSWVLPYLAITGGLMVKFPRYNVLITPFLVLLGALVLVEGARSLGRRAGGLLAALVLVPTVAWALAFTSIYTRPLTRVEASQWIYHNIAPGSVLTADSWDDRLPFPLSLAGSTRSPSEYDYFTTLFYEPDGEAKLQHIGALLDQADYVVISSNRLYGWMPRLDERYPVSARYFELLFDGRLGFEEVRRFTSYPSLGPFRLVDDRLDESLTVYDHPKVLIFQKRRELSEAELRPLFASALARVGMAAPAQERVFLLEEDPQDLPVVAERGWNGLANTSTAAAVVTWWAVLLVLGLVGLPLGRRLWPESADGGYLPGRALALLGAGFAVWLLASLHWAVYSVRLSWLAVLLLGLFGWLGRRPRGAVPGGWRGLLAGEAVFSAAFLIFVGIRLLNPDLWQPWLGGEKFMEMAYLQAILQSAHFPPYNPYFAGGIINYYYYGLYLVSLLVKLTGVVPEVAFNLAVPTLFALTVGGAFWLGRELGGTLARGLGAATLVAVLGNLDGLVQLGELLSQAGPPAAPGTAALVRWTAGLTALVTGRGELGAFDFWRATRVVPHTINEFPYFSFLFADLHPHMIGIPFVLTLVALAWQAYRRLSTFSGAAKGLTWPWRALPPLFWLAAPLTAGALAAINTWDFPTVALLLVGGLVLGAWGRGPRRGQGGAGGRDPAPRGVGEGSEGAVPAPTGAWGRGPRRGGSLAGALFSALGVAAASLILYLPFHARYRALGMGLGWVKDATPVSTFIVMWGLFLFLAATVLVAELLTRPGGWYPVRSLRLLLRSPRRLLSWKLMPGGRPAAIALLSLLVLTAPTAGLWLAGRGSAALVWPLLALAGGLALGRRGPAAPRFAAFVLALGLAILFGVEFVYLRDFLGGSEWYRMNTVFKFWIQAWVLTALGVGSLLGHAAAWLDRRGAAVRWGWGLAAAALLLAAAIYPLWGTQARVNDRFPGARPATGTLNGLGFMEVGRFTLPDEVGGQTVELEHELEAIRWLQANVRGTPVLAEAPIGYYREAGGRVATFTGLPMLVGMHQSEQLPAAMVGERDGDARSLFADPDPARALALIREHRIRYIYVGQLERSAYLPQSLAKFEELPLEVVYQNPGVRIYRVPEGVSP